MRCYLEEAVRDCGLDICREAATPATKDFDVDPVSPALANSEGDVFCSIVMKVFYVGLRSRPDFLVTLCFLCTRVQAPTHGDQRKLCRMLEYVKGTLDLVMTLQADSLERMFTFIDVAYGVHSDFKSQIGGCISFGTGSIVNRSTKQKLNVKSSTKDELVGASKYLPNAIWVQHFMAEQGYPIRHSFLKQDNESTIKLIKNGQASASRRSRHSNIRHFWIKDRLGTDGLHLRHCATEAMLSDFLSKHLQGSLFRKFHDVLLGYAHISALYNGLSRSSGPKERVEDQGKSGPRRTTAQTGAAPTTKSYADAAKKAVRFAAQAQQKTKQPSSEIV